MNSQTDNYYRTDTLLLIAGANSCIKLFISEKRNFVLEQGSEEKLICPQCFVCQNMTNGIKTKGLFAKDFKGQKVEKD